MGSGGQNGPPPHRQGSDVSRNRRLAEGLEVLHRVPEVSLDRSTEELLRDAHKEAHWQVVLELDRRVGAAARLGVGNVHGSPGATGADELHREGMWLVSLRRLLRAL